MSKKVIYLISFVVLLGVVSSASAALVAHWKFDNNMTDSVGTLTWDPNGQPAFSTDAKQGSHSLQLDGVDDYLSQTAAGPLMVAFSTHTIMLYFKANTTSGVQVMHDEGGSTNGLCIRINNSQLEVAVQNQHVIFTTATPFSSTDWTHVAATFNRGELKLYVNGTEQGSVMADFITVSQHTNTPGIGARAGQDAFDGDVTGDYFGGLIDDVQIYDNALLAWEIQDAIEGWPRARYPDPLDGAENVSVPLFAWTAGSAAVFHDVYFGTNPTPGQAEFMGRQPFAMYFHGPGLRPGTTYYWRIDEVEADGVTIHTGHVWSFSTIPVPAAGPNPADGAGYVDTEADLSWIAGSTAITHDIYFGTNQADVAAGTGDTFKGNYVSTIYDPGTLARGTTYYWRIDEVEADRTTKHKGNVWSFRTMPVMPITDPNLMGWWKLDDVGRAGIVIDYSGHDRHGTLRGDAQFVPGYDGDAVALDGAGDYVNIDGYKGVLGSHAFSITTWIKTTANGTIVNWGTQSGGQRVDFRTNSDRLRVEHGNGNLQGNTTVTDGQWHHVAVTVTNNAPISHPNVKLYLDGKDDSQTTTDPDTFNITANVDVSIGRRATNNDRYLNAFVDDVRIYDRELTQEEIRDTMRGDPTLAWNPKPANKSTTDVEKALPLSWSPGEKAAKHDVYLGTDQAAVGNADTTDATGIYRGRQDPNSYTPPEGVEFGKTYYWRIDEFNTDGTISTGRIWSFTVADYLIMDNFEDYDDTVNRIFDVWADYAVNNTGATVGYFDPPFAEQTIVHSGEQSMPYRYDLDGTVNEGTTYEKTGTRYYAEAERQWAAPQDWTRRGVKSLTLYFQGAPTRFAESAGTITMSAAGTDIWGVADEFRYAYKQLNGDGQIVAKVVNIGGPGTNAWRKAGVMIRESLDAGSRHAFMAITPDVTHGVAFQNRPTLNGNSVNASQNVGFTTPAWVKLVRQGGQFTGFYSTDGVNWIQVPPAPATNTDASPNPQTINMSANAYIGLALTSHQSGVSCVAEFSNVTITGATGAWTTADIGVSQPGNDPAPMYIVLQDSADKTAVVTHSDAAATLLATWTEWNIALTDFTGLNLRAIKKLSIGVGDRANPQRGGSGRLYVDDIQLRLPPLP